MKIWGVYVGGIGLGTVEARSKRDALKKARREFKRKGIWIEELDA
jgi:hypothetical protein